MTDLSIVIPAYNEQGNLEPLLEEIMLAFETCALRTDYEIIVIDDGSTDGSQHELEHACLKHARLKIYMHGRRAGKSAALKTGFDASSGGWIATLDADGQNNPMDLAVLWPRIEAGPPTCIYAGVRKSRNDGLIKKLTSRIANPLRRALLNDTARDTGCGFKVMPASLAQTLPYFDNLHRFIPALARRQGFAVENVPVDDRPRQCGVSKYGFFDRAAVAFLDVMGVYWLTRRYSDRGAIRELTVSAAPVSAEANLYVHQGVQSIPAE